MEKMDNMQEQMGNVSRQMEMLRIRSKCQKSKTEMKKGFDGLIRRLDMTKKIIYELEDMSIETSKTEKQREKRMEKLEQNIHELKANYRSCKIHIWEQQKGTEVKLAVIFPKLMTDTKTQIQEAQRTPSIVNTKNLQ